MEGNTCYYLLVAVRSINEKQVMVRMPWLGRQLGLSVETAHLATNLGSCTKFTGKFQPQEEGSAGPGENRLFMQKAMTN